MKLGYRRYCVLLLVVVFSLACSCYGQSIAAAARLLPAETVLLVETGDFRQLKEHFEQTSFYKVYQDASMSAFKENFETKWRQQVTRMDRNNILRIFYESDVLPKGKVAFALVVDEQAGEAKEPGFVAISEWGTNVDKIKAAMAKMLDENIALGGNTKPPVECYGQKVQSLVDEGGGRLSFSFVDDCLITSVNVELVKFVIAHIKGAGGGTLADDSDYLSATSTVGRNSDVIVYVNVKHLIKEVVAADDTGRSVETINNLGLDNLSGLSASVNFGRQGGISTLGKVFLQINGAKKGLCKMLEPAESQFSPPSFVPQETCSITFLNLDIGRAYDELTSILTDFSPEAASMMYMPLVPAGPQGESSIELKRDILAYLGSQIIISQSINKPFTDPKKGGASLVGISVTDRNRLERSLSRFHSRVTAASSEENRRELLGHNIYIMSIPSFLPFLNLGRRPLLEETSPKQPTMAKLAFTVTNAYLIIGSELGVDNAIRKIAGEQSSTLDTAGWYSTAKTAIPSVVGFATLENIRASCEMWWRMMKQMGDKSDGNAPPALPIYAFGPKEMKELVDLSLLPEFDSVEKYFGSSAAYGISRPNGFYFEFKNINKTDRD